MPSIDERVVAMSFENAKFEAGVAQTMRTLSKLNQSLAQIGSTSGLDKLEQQANKVTLQGPMSALDKLKQKLGMSVDTKPISDLEGAANKVTMTGPMSALDKLKQKLGMIGGGSEFASIQGASDQVTLDGVNKSVEETTRHFDAMRFAAIVAFGTIVHKATNAGLQLGKAITIQPLLDGFKNYETQINAVQTILANTGLTGKKGLDQVKGALGELNTYANKTVYNFSEMAKNIGTFTAAGVDLKTATGSIKGIANLAAMSGSNSQQASTAMYQLSQAISAGRVSLQDWNSVVNAGMGGTVFQRALAQTAVAMGTLDKNAVKLSGPMKTVSVHGESFRQSITAKPGEQSWLTSKVLTTALQNFTGDVSDAQLKAEGFTAAQIKSIQAQAKVAVDSATKIKTLSQLMQALKEEVASAWSNVFSTIFGDINQSKKLFSSLHTTIENALTGPINAFNKRLKEWSKLGGRTQAIEGFKNAFQALGKILGAVKKAFHDIFPPQTGKDLFALTVGFRKLTEHLKASPETLNNLRKTFRGFFAVLSIGWYIVKKVAGVIFGLLGTVGHGSGGFLKITGGIGDFLTALQKAIVKGDAFAGVFKVITDVLRFPLKILGELGSAFLSLFDGANSSKAGSAAKSLSGVNASLRPMQRILNNVSDAWHNFVDFLGKLGEKIKPAIDKVVEPFRHLADSVGNAIKGGSFDKVFTILQTALLGGIFVAIKKGLGSGIDVTVGKLDGLNKVMGGLTNQLTAMQRNVQANTLLQIGAAIALLAVGVAILATIDGKKLTSAMTAVAVGLGELVGALAVLGKVSKGAAVVTLPLIAFSMVELALAINVLAIAMKIFATMSWGDLVKGLVGVGGGLAAISVGTKLMGPSLTLTAPGLVAVALALNLLAASMKIFATMSWEEIAKGVAAVGASLVAIGLATKLMGPTLLISGPGLIAVAFALTLLAGAVFAFSRMSLESLAKGIGSIGLALAAIGLAISLIPPTVALQAAGLVVLAVALTGIAGAIALMGSMDITTLVKGIASIGITLGVLALGLTAMAGTLPGSVALLATAAALTLLVPSIALMGALSWGTIVKGLVSIAAVLVTLSLIGTFAASGLIALGVALTVLSVPVLVVGAGMYLLASAFAMLGESGTKGVAVLVAALTAFIAIIPKLIIDFIKGLVGIMASVADLAPKVVDSMVKIVGAVLDVIIKSAPKVAQAVGALITAFITVLDNNAGPLIAAGFRLLLHFLSGIANNIGAIVTQVALIVTRFLSALAAHLPAIVGAGFKVMIAFLSGVTQHVGQLITAGAKLIAAFLNGIANNVGRVIHAAGNMMVKFIKAIGDFATRVVTAGANAIVHFLTGIGNKLPDVIDKGATVAGKLIHAIAKALVKLADTGVTAIIDFLNGIARIIRKRSKAFWMAGWNIASAIVDGFGEGIKLLKHKFQQALVGWAGGDSKENVQKLLDHIKPGARLPGQAPPKKKSGKIAVTPGDDITNNIKSGLNQIPKLLADTDIQPVIAPVMDLTNVETGAKKMTDLMTVAPLKATTSADQAAAIAKSRGVATHPDFTTVKPVPQNVKFEQNNYSPEALSDLEIFRQTKNQLAFARKRLGLTKA